MQNYIVVDTYPDEVTARLAQATLAAENIESFVKMDDAGGKLESLQFVRGVRLLVEEKKVEEAREILSTQATNENT